MRLPLVPDHRTPEERDAALAATRDRPEARALLDAALHALDRPLADAARAGAHGPLPARFWSDLDTAYEKLDAYQKHLIDEAKIRISCQRRCSACCVDAPPILAVEGLRMARAMRRRADGARRVQHAVEHARAFQKLLLSRSSDPNEVDTSSPEYRKTQLHWRTLGRPCPFLGDDGNCGAYSDRPVACRSHYAVEDPAHCVPQSPRALVVERPRVWGHPRESEFELRLRSIGEHLGLPKVPNLQWGVARLHDHLHARA